MSRVRRIDIRQAAGKIIVVLSVLAALNVAFFLVFVQPEIRRYNELKDANDPRFEKLEERRQEVENHEAFLAAVHQADADLTSLREEILSTRNKRLVEVQQELAELCLQFKIDLDSVGFDHNLLLDEELDRMEMIVPLEGGYIALRNFLQAVEDSDKFLLVEGVQLSKGKEGGALLSLNINMATYFIAPEQLVERQRALQRGGRRSRS